MYASLGTCQTAIGLLVFSDNNGYISKDLSNIDVNIPLFIASVMSVSVSIATGIMFLIHSYHFARNRTTIENSTLYKENPFDKGFKHNWLQVFGEGWFTKGRWLIPVQTPGTRAQAFEMIRKD